MYTPASRVLSALEILQARGTVPAAELAERLEVEPRTVRRYVTALRDLGIPVESTPGRHGGYRLGPGSKLPPLMLSDGEALAIVVSLLGTLSRSPAGSTGTDAAAAMRKIHRVLPRELRERVLALRESVEFIDPTVPHLGWSRTSTDGAIVLAVAMAQVERQRLTIQYRSWEGNETTRQVDVYGLVQHLGAWYAVGWCHLREDVRVFRLDRIQSLATEPATFDLPVNFDARGHVARSLATAPYRWHIEIILEATMEQALPLVPETLAALRPVPDGVLLESGFEHLGPFARFIVSLGFRFRIVQPDELRDEIGKIGVELLEIAG